MGEALMKMYESLDDESKREAYNFVAYLVYKQNREKTASQEHIDKFFGVISDEDAAIMMAAIDECQ